MRAVRNLCHCGLSTILVGDFGAGQEPSNIQTAPVPESLSDTVRSRETARDKRYLWQIIAVTVENYAVVNVYRLV